MLFHSFRDATSNTNLLKKLYIWKIQIGTGSNKIQHDYVFSYVYQLKDRRSYQVNSANGQNVVTFFSILTGTGADPGLWMRGNIMLR